MGLLIAVPLVVKTTKPSPRFFGGIMTYLSVQESQKSKTKLLIVPTSFGWHSCASHCTLKERSVKTAALMSPMGRRRWRDTRHWLSPLSVSCKVKGEGMHTLHKAVQGTAWCTSTPFWSTSTYMIVFQHTVSAQVNRLKDQIRSTVLITDCCALK